MNARFLARTACTTSLIAIISLSAAPVYAQDASAEAAAAQPVAAEEADTGDAIIVTAQKREEKLLDVPIAITAISADALDNQKIEGGSELLRAVPNVNFSKSNFSMYNFSIRGIGTKAISASSDPAVAVSFNNTPLIRNRLFESEFFDMARVEVLRGPQGTLYGRNATGGVVNILPAMPKHKFEGEIKGEVGSYETRRLSGMINVPLGDTLAFRASGAWTKRDGFDYNTYTQKNVNGRDLWSTRAILAWEPSDRFRANVIWQHFEEEDDRSRTGKNLCTRDPGKTMVGTANVPADLQARLSQGCLPGSLYNDAAYGVPNSAGLAYVVAGQINNAGTNPATNRLQRMFRPGDPFGDIMQSKNLREISTSYDPIFRAKNDLFQGNIEFDLTDGLKFISQSAYARDRYFSSQDFNRFVSGPMFLGSGCIKLLA